MIANKQKTKIVERILSKFYKNGKVPYYDEFLGKLQNTLKYKVFGQPFFSPRMVISNTVIDPLTLKTNADAIKEDVETLQEDYLELEAYQVELNNKVYGQLTGLNQRAKKFAEEIDNIIARKYYGGNEIFQDTFRSTDNIDLSLTDAFIDPTNGYVTLPLDLAHTKSYYGNNLAVISESGDGVRIQGTFENLFTDYIQETWQVNIPTNGTHTVIVNTTNQDIVLGHKNELYLNRISFTCLSTFTIKVESSIDGKNYDFIAEKEINSSYVLDFEPRYALFLRFTFSGSNISVSKIILGLVDNKSVGTLISKQFISNTPIYSITLNTKEDIPYGSSIDKFIGPSNQGPWTPVVDGYVNLFSSTINTLNFPASGSFSAVDSNDPGTLYRLAITGLIPIAESGSLKRGYGQFKAECFGFNWTSSADEYHTPSLEDWDRNLGLKYSCYMSTNGVGTPSTPIPTLGNTSILYKFSNATQDYLAIGLQTSGGMLVQSNSNYRFTTYLYSDRNITVNSAAGGLYVIDAGSGSDSAPPIYSALGWALYVNSTKIVSDNRSYSIITTPSSAAIPIANGKSFPFNLVTGWNKIEILVYNPGNLDPAITNKTMVLLLRPNLFNFTVTDSQSWYYSPKILKYNIWADGSELTKVSEFYLKWNTSLLERDSWAWKIDSSTGGVTDLLVPYLPTNVKSIDGILVGSDTQFRLEYDYIFNQSNSLYFKAVLNKRPEGTQAPKLYNYRIIK